MVPTSERLILASASTARVRLLRAAAVDFTAIPSAVDEGAVKARFRAAGGNAVDCAAALAVAKADDVARAYPNALVIGADQILVCDGDWFDKPRDSAEAAAHLRRLSGRSHVLATAACAVCGATLLWQATSAPELTMRRFGEAFLNRYIALEGERVLGSVGGYRIESRGVQLFDRIDGDYFAILGLPLIELLRFLRGRGLVGE